MPNDRFSRTLAGVLDQWNAAAGNDAERAKNAGDWLEQLREAAGLAPAPPESVQNLAEVIRSAGKRGDANAALAALKRIEHWPELKPAGDWKGAELPEPVLWQKGEKDRNAVLSAGEVALLSGAGGMGKSTLALQFSKAAADTPEGEPGAAAGLWVRGGPAVLVSYEDAPARIAGRLLNFGGIPESLTLWANPQPLFTGDPLRRGAAHPFRGWRTLFDGIARRRPSIVVIDPASVALTGASGNEDAPVRAFMQALRKEAEVGGYGVLLVAHDTKAARNEAAKGGDPGAGAISGNRAWHDEARGAIYMRREGEQHALICIKSNYGAMGWTVFLQSVTDPWRGFEPCSNPRIDSAPDRTDRTAPAVNF